ncbi:MAG: hypothetical protein A2045_09965 [Rhodocyclales bacterium GWA2_65_20]|nr:MAG: hypothetical protein A2045_09965 [Rhodocyclales bacterium GWA2_65_20]
MFARFACLLLLLFSLSPVSGAAVLAVGPTDTMQPLNGLLEIRRDDSARLSFEDLQAEEREGRSTFVAATPKLLNPGYSKAAYWLRVRIANRSDQALERWLVLDFARLREVTLFVPHDDGRVDRIETGARLRFGERPVAEEKPVLPLQLAAGQTQTFYLRIASETTMRLEASLWDQMTFRTVEDDLHKRNFLLFGALGMVVFSGLFMFFSLRQSAFLYQASAVFCYLIFESGFAGYTLRYLWPDAPEWDLRIVGAAPALASLSELLYLRVFLQSRKLLPRIDKFMRVVIAGECLAGAIAILGDYRFAIQVSQPFMLAAALVSPVAAVLAWRKGLVGARFVLLAMVILWGMVITRVMIGYGLIPHAVVFVEATPWAMLAATTLMLWAVTDRVVLLQRENARLDARNRRKLEEQVAERTDELHQALRAADASSQAKSDFLAHVSHDLRAPLTTILGYAAVLATDAQTAKRLEPGAIERSAHHLLSLIDDLIHAAKGEDSVQELMIEPVRLDVFVSGIGEHAEMLAQKHGNRFEMNVVDPLPAVVAIDAKRLRQVLLNLLDNACKFTENGCITLKVASDTPAPAPGEFASLCFSVTDSGIGIPEEEQRRIFEPLYRVAGEWVSPRGIGLGLAIVAKWVDLMGGEIAVESAPGQGSRFFFCIDCAVVTETTAPRPHSHRVLPDGTEVERRILVAEDDDVFRDFLRRLFESAGFAVVAVASGAEAIAAEAAQPFDLVVTDQKMPQTSGWDVLRAIGARHGDGGGPPVILVSSVYPYPPANWPSDLSFTATFLKPVDADAMLSRVAELLQFDTGTQVAPIMGRTMVGEPFDAPPSPERMQQLRDLAEQGAVSDILEWAAVVAAEDPQANAFAEKVALAARRIDLAYIRNVSRREN